MSLTPVFDRAFDLILDHGWCQRDWRDASGRVCLVQAIKDAAGDDKLVGDAVEVLYRYLGLGGTDRDEDLVGGAVPVPGGLIAQIRQHRVVGWNDAVMASWLSAGTAPNSTDMASLPAPRAVHAGHREIVRRLGLRLSFRPG